MLKPLHMQDWFSVIDNFTADERINTMVNCYPKPSGCFYEVKVVEGIPILESNNRIYTDNPIASELSRLGYTGKIIVEANGMSNQQMPRWLTYQFINSPNNTKLEENRWLSGVTVYILGTISGPSTIAVQSINPIAIPVYNIVTSNRDRSKSTLFDGYCFNHDGSFYHILPSRSTRGIVRSQVDNEFVVLVNLPEGVRPIMAKYNGEYELTESIIGKEVKIRYTEQLAGCCINNLMSASIIIE